MDKLYRCDDVKGASYLPSESFNPQIGKSLNTMSTTVKC